MRLLHAIWGVLSLVLAFGINEYMAPRVDRVRDPSELRTAAGKLVFRHAGSSREFPLVTIRPLVEDLVYPFGKRIEVRELSLRSASQVPEDPDLELFVDLTPTGASSTERELRPWLRRALPIVPASFSGEARSRVRLQEGAEPVGVVEGALTLSRAVPLAAGKPGENGWRVRGELVLTVMPAGGAIEQATGTVEAQVLW